METYLSNVKNIYFHPSEGTNGRNKLVSIFLHNRHFRDAVMDIFYIIATLGEYFYSQKFLLERLSDANERLPFSFKDSGAVFEWEPRTRELSISTDWERDQVEQFTSILKICAGARDIPINSELPCQQLSLVI